jgi:RNA polymerase sigma factor (sigma-70 family)
MTMEPPPGLLDILARDAGAIRRFLVARTRNEGLAEDLMSELWIKARATDNDAVENAPAYLYQMANNLVLDHLREERRRAAREERWTAEHIGAADHGKELPAPEPNAEETLADSEERAKLAAAIALLPDGARRVLRLHKLDGLSHGEVASLLGISKSAVEKHMAVAMAHLRRHLAGLR